ncbi:MAG: hypothetical protein Q9163_006148 [Psora crenata]
MSPIEEKWNFTSGPQTVPFNGILFDMDGTIIDSTDAIVKYWHLDLAELVRIGKDLGIDPIDLLKDAHGRRSIDTLRLYNAEKANWQCECTVRATRSDESSDIIDISHMEGLVPKQFGQGAKEIPGARELLASLEGANAPWAIVTSGTRPLVNGWLDVMKLAHPKRMITAEDVKQGKPGQVIDLSRGADPECYLLAKERLSLSSNAEGDILVVEDAPAGIRAGVEAGCKVIGLATSHSVDRVVAAGAHWVVKDLESVKFRKDAATTDLTIEISNALVR